MKHVDIEHLLPFVEKPSRYINHEINACTKDFPSADVRFSFAFPDLYELGISHLGLKIMYSIINQLVFAMADRAYLPWTDMSARMREESLPLFGWESRMPLKCFDAIGITLQSELTYTNVLELIDLAQLPLRSINRIDSHPIVIAGGPCASNPLPLSPFIDVFYIGEAEEGIIQIANILHTTSTRAARMQELAGLESCYVPTIHDRQAIRIRSRKFVGFSDSTHQHKPQLLSWQLATHNRYVAEIMRGCSRGCRFCHAGYFYRPVRERSPEAILADLLTEINESGWDEAGLVSLSSSDYTCIQPLFISLLESVNTDKTHISLPSLRVDSLSDELVSAMHRLGREGLTLAPEAGSQRLRNVINKNLSEVDILSGVETAIKLGWQRIKLYFMLGLPMEDDSDIQAIIALIDQINTIGKRRLQISITLSPFVPKPFTPFQWAAMLDKDSLLNRVKLIKNTFQKARNIKVRYHTIESSLLEAVLSRGDEHVADAIEAAWKAGARFDGWNECFDFGVWQAAFTTADIDYHSYLQAREPLKPLPWDFIDTGVCQEFLISEWDKAQQAIETADCRELCTQCGVCNEQVHPVLAAKQDGIPFPGTKESTIAPKQDMEQTIPLRQYRYRVHYQKLGLLRFISHLDWMRMLFRRIAILDLQTVFTQGFSPHPKVSLSPPLPIGVEGMAEFFDISFCAPYSPQIILQEFRKTRIPDFSILSCEPNATKGSIPLGEQLVIELPASMHSHATKQISQFNERSTFPYTKSTEKRQKSYDLRKLITSIELKGNRIFVEKLLASPALFDILAALLDKDKDQMYSLSVKRTGFTFLA